MKSKINNSKSFRNFVIFTFFAIFASASISGQVFECTFNNGFFTDYKNTVPKSGNGSQIKNKVTFSSFDNASGTAKFSGNAGQTTVVYSANDKGLHFLEITDSGNHNLTTIFLPARHNGKFAVVHSRHVYINHPLPSQSVGFCLKK
jgi:hypothetical protein